MYINDYYILKSVYGPNSTIYKPIGDDNLRAVLTKKEADKLVKSMKSVPVIIVENDKQLEGEYKSCIRSNDATELVKLLKTIYQRREARFAAGRKETSLDAKYFKMAGEYLYGEFAISLNIPKEEVEGYIDNSGNGATGPGATTAGGILGKGENGTVIINCSVAGAVLSYSNVGGIAGGGAVTIVNCYNEATVKFYSDTGQVGGGIYGYGGSPTIINCYNVGQVINTGLLTYHMGNIAARTGHVLHYDALRRTFHDKAADRLIARPYRKPWKMFKS